MISRRQVGLAADEPQRPAGVVADQRLAQPQHHLGVDLVAVAGERVDGVDHEGVIGLHDLLDEHRHPQAVVGDAAGATREVRPVVPLGGPDAPDAAPGLLPGDRRQARRAARPPAEPPAMPRAADISSSSARTRGRTSAGSCSAAATRASYLPRSSRLPSSCQRSFKSAEGQGEGGRQVNPVGQPAAQPVQVVGLAAHDLAA